jgi:hypothetical protein
VVHGWYTAFSFFVLKKPAYSVAYPLRPRFNGAHPLDSLVFFLILLVALMPGRLGYDEGASRRSKEEGYPIAKAGVNDSAAISAITNVPCVTHLSTNLVI